MIVPFFIFLVLFAILLFVGVAWQRFSVKQNKSNEIEEFPLSVIIPFRNEELNLPSLIESIRKQTIVPHQILFIDDHSSDKGKQLLEKSFSGKQHVSIISLPESIEGKKGAIHFGVNIASGDYCLTLDADVEFNDDYFECISQYSNSDMTIAPVIMKSKSLWGRLFGFEYLFFNAFNFVFASFYINTASGANLLFSREKYVKFNALKEHDLLASGDDHFLLRDFQRNKANISLSNHLKSAVYSKSVENWKEYFNQRIRWISKSKNKPNWKELGIGSLLLLYLLGSFIMCFFLVIQKEYSLFYSLLSLRFLADFFVFSNYASRLSVLNYFLLYPVFFVLYPVMFTSILVGMFFFQPKWKGRPLIKKI